MSAELGARYLGLDLRTPLVASSSPLTGRIDDLLRLDDAGIGAVVLPSLFEEEVEHAEMQVARLQDYGSGFAEAMDYFPTLPSYGVGPEEYLDRVRVARERLSVPVVASINGTSAGGWVRYARLLAEAGASAIELNFYDVPTDAGRTALDLEDHYLALVGEVRAAISVPLAVKLSPFYTSLGHFAARLADAGVDGLVLFNRFVQPDIDLEAFDVQPGLSLSSAWEVRLPLRWIAILRGQVTCSLAASSGVASPEDVVKLLAVGADAVMSTSAFLRHGPAFARTLLDGLQSWLDEREYVSVRQLQGSMSLRNAPSPKGFERAHYMRALKTWVPE